MAVAAGTLVLASEYNTVAELVNKVFGDKYSSVVVTEVDRTTHKFGWGAVNIADALADDTLITAERLQSMVDRTNIMVDHTNINDTILVFSIPSNRIDVLAKTPIRAEDLNIVQTKVNTSILSNNVHLTIDPTNASSNNVTPVVPYIRETPWQNKLIAEHKWTFNSYNHARYFFNSGGQVRLNMGLTGGSTAGYYNWSDIINEIGVLSFSWNNLLQSSSITAGTSEGKGFYNLTDAYGDGTTEEGLLFTSSGVTSPNAYGYGYGYGYGYAGLYINNGAFSSSNSAYGYGYGYGYGYSGYSNRYMKLYGKWANNGTEVHFKIVLDDTAFSQVTDGTMEASCSYLMPDAITKNTATFDVSPDPVFSVTNNFNTADDS
tara:strand:+ start:878 stop:2002 length:1125 start_codon:yes stop_codon:yes gene_type:complete